MKTKIQILLIVIQLVVLVFIAVAPFGFDHRSEWGLDYDDFLKCVLLYCLAVAGGIAMSVAKKRWWLMVAQLAVITTAAIVLFRP